MKIGRIRNLQSVKYINKKRRRLIILISIYSISIIIILIILGIIIRMPQLQVNNISLMGNVEISASDIKEKVMKEIDGNYLYVIPKSSPIFYPKTKIMNVLLINFPKVNSLNISLADINTLQIKISERLPEVTVCNGYKDDEDSVCFYSDKDGYIYEKARLDDDIQYLKYYINNASTTEIGSNFIDKEKFYRLQKFIDSVNSSGIAVNGILIGNDNSYELYIKNIDKSDAVIYFDDRTPFEKTLSNLVIFWNNVKSKKIGLDNIPNFAYINLKFGNNVFYLTR